MNRYAPATMKIITWNVNSVRQRLARIIALLERHEPDVLCLQETKTTDDAFPFLEIEALGYTCSVFGQAGRNGVALIAKDQIEGVTRGFPGDPVPEQARAISGTVGGIRMVNLYVVNGKTIDTPEYDTKLEWFDALTAWIKAEHDPERPLVVVGDFNVTPDDRDVHDPEAWRGQNLASEAERQRIRTLTDWGLVDLLRLHHAGPGPFTWWDYRMGALHRGWGLRIDLALGTRSVAERCIDVTVDRDERKPTSGEGKPSDHAPVIVTFS